MSEGQVGGEVAEGGTVEAVGTVPAAEAPAPIPVSGKSVVGAIGAVPVDESAQAPESVVPSAAPAWAGEGLDADDIAFLTNKGLDKAGKTTRDLIQIARHQDSLRGIPADQLTRLPNFNKPEEVAEFNAKVGVPVTPDAYEPLEVMIGEGELDTSILSEMSHKAGLRPDQHVILAQAIGEWANGQTAEQAEMARAESEKSAQELERAWGDQYNANVAIANKAAVRFDVSNDEFKTMAAALGPKRAAEIWHAVGLGMGEHKPAVDAETNNATGAGMTKDVAIAMRAKLMKDTGFFQRMEEGDEAARSKWANINRIASS